MLCPRCQREAPAGARFCPECGSRLTPRRGQAFGRDPDERARGGTGPLPEGERKQVTVLFADLKGSMELLADRDPEEAEKLLEPIIEYMIEGVTRHEGLVNHVMGDGIMALFGVPLAREDHAVQGCFAALRMQESVTRYGDEMQRLHGVPLQIRVGLASGEVVLRAPGGEGHSGHAVFGQTVHVAARMEQMAKPGSILATEDTRRLARGWVDTRPLGPVKVKGLETPVEVHEVVGARAASTRLQAAASRGLTPFVGRAAELGRLCAALDRVRAGAAELVALVGELGVGKSRLVREFLQGPWTRGCLVLEGGSVAYGAATAYLPGVEMLRRYFGLDSRDDPAAVREKVAARVRALDPDLEPAVEPLLAVVEALPEESPFRTLVPAERRERAVGAILQLMLRESAVQPIVLVCEDLHWAHVQTQRALDVVLAALPPRTLVVVTYRPGYDDGWGSRPHYTRLHVDPLGAAPSEELLTALLGDDPSLGPVRRLLLERAEGNPLFMEECVRSLVHSRALAGARGAYRLLAAPATLEVPASLQALLTARIDRLPAEEKHLLQSAAVIGEDVPTALLSRIADLSEERVRAGLAHLERAELLVEARGTPPPAYRFTHSLTRNVAYDMLLHERHRQLHAAIVDAMEALYADRLDEHLDRLAHHAYRGEAWERAARYLHRAGQRSLASFAGREAIAYLEQALQALARLPHTPAWQAEAVDIHLELRNALVPSGQHGEIAGHLDEAHRLAEALGDPARLARVLSFLSNQYWNVGENARAAAVGRRALSLAEEAGDLGLQILANFSVGGAHRSLGDYRVTIDSMRRVIALLDGHHTYDFFGQHGLPAVLARSHLVWSLAELGHFAEATATAEESIGIAEAAQHAYTLSHAYLGLGGVLVRQGLFERAIPVLERGLAGCDRVPLLFPPLAADLGLAVARTGDPERGLALATSAVERATSMGRLGRLPLLLTHLGDVAFLAGRPDEALRHATRAHELAVAQLEQGNEVYALRLLAKLAVRHEPPEAARGAELLARAIALAEKLGLRPLRARCALLHAQLARLTGRGEAARHYAFAATLFQDMGMRFWSEYVQAEQRHRGEETS